MMIGHSVEASWSNWTTIPSNSHHHPHPFLWVVGIFQNHRILHFRLVYEFLLLSYGYFCWCCWQRGQGASVPLVEIEIASRELTVGLAFNEMLAWMWLVVGFASRFCKRRRQYHCSRNNLHCYQFVFVVEQQRWFVSGTSPTGSGTYPFLVLGLQRSPELITVGGHPWLKCFDNPQGDSYKLRGANGHAILILMDVAKAEDEEVFWILAMAMAMVAALANFPFKQKFHLQLKLQLKYQNNTTLTVLAKIPNGDGMKQMMLNPQVNKNKRN